MQRSLAAAWVPLALACLPRAAAAQSGSEVLLEVRLGEVASASVFAWQDSTGSVLLPIPSLLDLAGIDCTHGPLHVQATIEPAGIPLAIDISGGSVRLGTTSVAVERDQLASHDGKPHAALELLEQLLGVRALVDWETATIALLDVDHLPVSLRAARERERARLEASRLAAPPPSLVLPTGRGSFGGFALDYRLLAEGMDPGQNSAYDVALFTDLIGGTAFLRANGATGAHAHWAGSWGRVWSESPLLRQLRVGDVVGAGSRPRITRGVIVTNAPVERPLVVEQIPFSGTLAPDWVIEAYRGGALIEFDSVGTTGQWELTLPVYSGENGVEFRAYGPHGEVRVFDRAFRVLPGLIQSRAFEYGLSGGACPAGTGCDAAGTLDLRYGLSARWSLRAGVDVTTADSTDVATARAYGSVVGSPFNALGVELEAMERAFRRVSLRLEPTSRLLATATYAGYDEPAPSPAYAGSVRRSALSLYGRWIPADTRTRLVAEAQLDRRDVQEGSLWEGRLAATLRAPVFQLRPSVEAVLHSDAPLHAVDPLVGLETTVLPRPNLAPLWLRTDVAFTTGGDLMRADLTAASEAIPRVRIEAGARWRRAAGTAFTLQLRSALPVARAATTLTVPVGGASRVAHSLEGSLLWDGAGNAIIPVRDRVHGQAALTGRVFLDMDGDGMRSKREPGLEGVRVDVGTVRVRTDADGQFRLSGVPAYSEVRIAIDPATLENPWWLPAHPVVAVTVGANPMRSVDLPVVIGAVLEGSVVAVAQDGTPAHPPGQLLLTERSSGHSLQVDVLSDGSFFALGVPPGDYAIGLPEGEDDGAQLITCPSSWEVRPAALSGETRHRNAAGPEQRGLRVTLGVPCPTTESPPQGAGTGAR